MLEELRILGEISHPNIVKLIGYCKTEHDSEDRSCLLYEFMPEGTLSYNLFEGNKPMIRWKKRICILLDISKAVSYLHGKGLVYRDLKADNIALDSELRAKLFEFGSIVPEGTSIPSEQIGYFIVCARNTVCLCGLILTKMCVCVYILQKQQRNTMMYMLLEC
ncbi:Non-specific serine/threonine protein kinase protein [Dioscorea alata]|uniref:Non-specific serine/threonine protein kinase protein n=2 Tax=Dioscorea alata TaxID=55571 RepID=A0ACB7V893_DIOAL|nr:Non-specific serine/threonine protein kinase protein [Dioscorea alata]KAH7669722.1 Non-specific serine/threonine protein kinase protein [Dioscorea alata]